MPSIDRLAIRKILDSRGNATVEVDVVAGRAVGRVAAPSGASTGALESPSWPPTGVDGALRIFQDSIVPRLRGRDVKDQAGLDRTLRELDGTPNFALIRDALMKRLPGVPLGRGDEGAWVAQLQDEEALSLLADVCRKVEREAGFPVRPALDFAASEFYRGGKYRYRDRALSAKDQIDFVERLARDFSLFSVEDPFDQEDFGSFTELTKRIGDRCKVIGDDIFVTNVERLRRGIEQHAANAILIKPNQIGTLSETRAAVDLAHSAGYATVMSHRSGETTDDTIAHLAVAFGCLGIKTGAVGGERIAKLNELIRIEEQLQAGA